MNPSVGCYPQPGKARSREVLEAFAKGAGGEIRVSGACLQPGAAAFYGVVGIEHLLHLAIAEGRDWYYGDNAFFDVGRGKFFRFARRTLQPAWMLNPDYIRLQDLGAKVRPWRRDGRRIVVVEQSEHFLKLVGANRWLERVLADLAKVTDRPIKVRRWSRDKIGAAKSLQLDLHGAWALVTHMSAAANEALLAGVPVFVSGLCAATPMASGELKNIENPRYPEGREDWAAGLAAEQWTLEEIRNGMAWRRLNGL